METSENYNFNLPSRDDGVEDFADINKISENFSIIDSALKEIVDGKQDSFIVGNQINLSEQNELSWLPSKPLPKNIRQFYDLRSNYGDGIYKVTEPTALWTYAEQLMDKEKVDLDSGDIVVNYGDVYFIIRNSYYIEDIPKLQMIVEKSDGEQYIVPFMQYEAGENITIENNVISANVGATNACGIHEITEDVTTAEISEGMSKVIAEDGVSVSYMNGGEYSETLPVSNGSILFKAYNADGYVTNILVYDLNGSVYSITQEYMNDTATLNILTPKSPETEDTEINSWSDVQKVVRMGQASQIFEVGDQFVSTKDGQSLVWDVIGFDHDFPIDNDEVQHSMTLQLHDATGAIQFDAQEAFYYAADGLAAGTYNFTVGEHDWVASEVGKTYQFTITQPVPANGQIVLNAAYNATMEGTNISTYASGSSTTAIETVGLTEGTGGTSLGTMNNAAGGNFNSCQRAFLGSNDYAQSALRQYINSEAASGSVWTSQSNFDRPPSWVSNTAGFLYGMDEDFLSVIGEVGKTTALNTASEEEESVTTTEKFFLLSRSEVYGGNENNINEGAAYPYYSENSAFSEALPSADSIRIKYLNKEAQYWWLRSPYTDDSSSVRTVFPTGYIGKLNASISLGVAPACCIY